MAKSKQGAPPEPAPDSVELPPGLLRIQAEHSEPEPKVAPLVKPAHGIDAPPAPPVAAPAPAPRAVHQNERAPAGLRRFKVHSQDPPAPFRYVLAAGREEAVNHYLESTGVRAVLDALPEHVRPPVRLTVRDLPD